MTILDLRELLVGSWTGSVRTWLVPDAAPLTNEVTAEFRLLLSGDSILHEYTSRVGDDRADGVAIIGKDIATDRPCLTWVDSFHTGSHVMRLELESAELTGRTSFLGAYAAGATRWQWRIVIAADAPDTLRIEHFNISPEGEVALAVEAIYRRTSSARDAVAGGGDLS